MRTVFSRLAATGVLGCVLLLGAAPATQAAGVFRRPLNTALTPAVSYFYDHNTGSGVRTYDCRTDKVYNDHRGTDFRATVGTPVYAARAGSIYQTYNGCPTYGFLGSTCGQQYGNHVRMDHEGNLTDGQGLVSIYAHLTQNSAAWPSSGIACGRQIGLSGSSGNSTGPHVHFEVRQNGYPNDDPFSGMCGNAASMWVNQNGGVPTTQCVAWWPS